MAKAGKKREREEETKQAAEAEGAQEEEDEEEESDDDSSDSDSSVIDSEDELNLDKKCDWNEGEGPESDSDEESKVMMVDFDFNEPKPIHFKSIRGLLNVRPPTDVESFNITEFVDTICEQTDIGTMIEQDPGEEDTFGFSTVLGLDKFKDLGCMKTLKEYVLRKTGQGEARDVVERLFNDPGKKAGLLVTERIPNLPVELVGPLHESLKKDVEEKGKANKELKFEQVLLMTRCHVLSSGANPGAGGGDSKKKKQKQKAGAEDDIYFNRFEDEIFLKV